MKSITKDVDVLTQASLVFLQVRGIETETTYDPATQEFIINPPCESAQKYWIGGVAQVHNHWPL
jgi:hypothetical protein